jgi:hypothetical protein
MYPIRDEQEADWLQEQVDGNEGHGPPQAFLLGCQGDNDEQGCNSGVHSSATYPENPKSQSGTWLKAALPCAALFGKVSSQEAKEHRGYSPENEQQNE